VFHLRSTADLSGPDRVLLDLLPALQQRGVRCVLGVLSDRRRPADDLLLAARRAGVAVAELSTRGPLDPRLPLRVARRIAADGHALVHAHDPKSHVVAAAASVLAAVPWVATHHGWLSRGPKERLYERAGAAALRSASAVVCVSDAGREALSRLVSSEQVVVVANGIRADRVVCEAGREAARHRLGVDAALPLLLACGRLEEGKGHGSMIRAAHALHARHGLAVGIVVLGEGPRRRALRALAADLGLADRLRLPGFLADAPELLCAADVFVLPSLAEQHPVALLEAMAAGLPVVASRVGGVERTLGSGIGGRLVEPGDDAALAATLADVLTAPDAAAAMGRAARRRIRECFDDDRMAAAYAEIYADV